MNIKYIDLCCGIGGFRVGIERFQQECNDAITFECVFSADIKKDALDTYNANFGTNLTPCNIYDIETLPEFDMLCAGFPCQPFSSAGNKKGFDDKRGGMIFQLADICSKYHPRFVVLENVSNLLLLENGTIINRICSLFEDIGYTVSFRKINSATCGVPQRRERVYIVCCLDNKKVNLENIGTTTDRKLIGEILDMDSKYTDIPKTLCDKLLILHKTRPIYGIRLQDKRGGAKNIHSWDLELGGTVSCEEKDLLSILMTERRKKHWAIKKEIEWMDGMPLTFQEISSFFNPPNLQTLLDGLIEKKYLVQEKPKELVNGKRNYKENGEEGYNICKGKLSFPISVVLNPNDVCPTLTATDGCKLAVMIDELHIRSLNNIELKRVCGFPDDFIVPEHVKKYDLFGNMVTPPVVTKILHQIFSDT